MNTRDGDGSNRQQRLGMRLCIASIALGPGVMLACLLCGRLFRLFRADGDLGMLLFGVSFVSHCVAMFACVFALSYSRRGWWLLAALSTSYELWFFSRCLGM